MECEDINSTAVINRLKYTASANCWDLGGVTPENYTCMSFDLGHLIRFGEIYQ